jgi:hypothetical protein
VRRRRAVEMSDPPPQRLCRFVESEWPGDDPIGAWRDACLGWLREVEGRRLPFGEYGGSVDLFRECRRVQMELAKRAGGQ